MNLRRICVKEADAKNGDVFSRVNLLPVSASRDMAVKLSTQKALSLNWKINSVPRQSAEPSVKWGDYDSNSRLILARVELRKRRIYYTRQVRGDGEKECETLHLRDQSKYLATRSLHGRLRAGSRTVLRTRVTTLHHGRISICACSLKP